MAAFENIVLLQNEEKLLRKMLDYEPRDSSVQGVLHLHELGLVNMAQQIPNKANGYVYKMQFVINQTGTDYLLYIGNKKSITTDEKTNNEEMMRLTKQGISISKIAAIASVVSAILAAVAIVVTIVLK